jgi:hypothetical protein
VQAPPPRARIEEVALADFRKGCTVDVVPKEQQWLGLSASSDSSLIEWPAWRTLGWACDRALPEQSLDTQLADQF